MKCPKCHYVSFEYLDECKKCCRDLTAYKSDFHVFVQKPVPVDIFASQEGDGDTSEEFDFESDVDVSESEVSEEVEKQEEVDAGEIDLGMGEDGEQEAFLEEPVDAEEIDLSLGEDDIAVEDTDALTEESEEVDLGEIDLSDDLSDDLNDDLSAELEGNAEVLSQEEPSDEVDLGISFTEDAEDNTDLLTSSDSDEVSLDGSEDLDLGVSDDIDGMVEYEADITDEGEKSEDEGLDLELGFGDEDMNLELNEGEVSSDADEAIPVATEELGGDGDIAIFENTDIEGKNDDNALEELDLELGFGDEDINLDLSDDSSDDAIGAENEAVSDILPDNSGIIDDFLVSSDDQPEVVSDDPVLPDFDVKLEDSFLEDSDSEEDKVSKPNKDEKDSKEIDDIDLEIDESFFTEDDEE